jgi:hypothetical protein
MGAPTLLAEAGGVTGATRKSNERIHVYLRITAGFSTTLQIGIMQAPFVTRQPASVTVP